MLPFRNLTDFNLAVAVLSRLPAFLPGRNDRLAHFLNDSLTDKSVTITPSHIAPFEQEVRALDPDLLSVRNPYDTSVKRKLDAHAGAYPEFALPHFVLIPPASQVQYNDYPRCTSCSKVLQVMVAPVQGNPADGPYRLAWHACTCNSMVRFFRCYYHCSRLSGISQPFCIVY